MNFFVQKASIFLFLGVLIVPKIRLKIAGVVCVSPNSFRSKQEESLRKKFTLFEIKKKRNFSF